MRSYQWHQYPVDDAFLVQSLPYLVSESGSNQHTILIVGGLHGDEPIGASLISIISELTKALPHDTRVIFFPVASPLAFVRETRRLPGQVDANRTFGGGSRSQAGGKILDFVEDIVRNDADLVFDIHSAPPFLHYQPHVRIQHKRLAVSSSTDTLFIVSPPEQGSLRHQCNELGVPAFTIEAGTGNLIEKSHVTAISNMIVAISEAYLGENSSRFEFQTSKLFRLSAWQKLTQSGLLIFQRELGQRVDKGDSVFEVVKLGCEVDIERVHLERSDSYGIILGVAQYALGYRGDIIFRLAEEIEN